MQPYKRARIHPIRRRRIRNLVPNPAHRRLKPIEIQIEERPARVILRPIQHHPRLVRVTQEVQALQIQLLRPISRKPRRRSRRRSRNIDRHIVQMKPHRIHGVSRIAYLNRSARTGIQNHRPALAPASRASPAQPAALQRHIPHTRRRHKLRARRNRRARQQNRRIRH